MRERPLDPRHLDVEAFAERAGVLDGRLPVDRLVRLGPSTHAEALPGSRGEVAWRIEGARRSRPASGMSTWLDLAADCTVEMTCQRCLQGVVLPLAVRRNYRFVADEATAAEVDVEAEEDVLVSTRSLDLPGLIEDELLLALPLVPRHEGACPQPLVDPSEAAAMPEDTPRDSPFKGLAALKLRKVTG